MHNNTVLTILSRQMRNKKNWSLKNIEGLEEAHALYGVYDLIIKIKANSLDKLKDTVKSRIKQIPGVTRSLTLMIIDH